MPGWSPPLPPCPRVYDAVACGCVPVLLSRYLRWDLAFRALLPWADATLAVAEADFAAAPGPALDRLLGTVTAGRYRRLRRGCGPRRPGLGCGGKWGNGGKPWSGGGVGR